MNRASEPRPLWFRHWSGRGVLARSRWILGLLALGVLTAWNLTRTGPRLDEARKAYLRRDLPMCIRQALDCLDRRPWDKEAARLAALSLSQLDYAGEAEAYYRRAESLSLADLHIRAYGLVRGNFRSRAIGAYNDILTRWPDNVTALRRLAAVQITENNNDELLRLADRLIRISSGAATGYTLRGVVYHNSREYHNAAVAFEKVLALDPELRTMPLPRNLFWGHLTDDLVASGRVEVAQKYLSSAVAKAPDATLMNMLGKVEQLTGSIEEAERCWRQAAEWAPKNPDPLLRLGRLALTRGHYDEALEYLSRAASLAPNHYETVSNLALVYRKLGKIEDAQTLETKAKGLRPGQPPAPPAREQRLPSYAL